MTKERVCRWWLIIALTAVAAGFAPATLSEMTMRLKVDHATVCGSELEPMREAFANIGLGTDYGGPHANDVTHMALVGFEDGSYLELIAPMKAGESVPGFTSSWEKLMAGNAGPCAWAVATPDIKQDVERLKIVGISTVEMKSGSRKRTDGMAMEWTTADVGSG